MKRYDWAIRDATVYDGSGSAPFVADVALCGQRIEAIGVGLGLAANELSARRKALSPGFVDVHSHDDFAALLQPELGFKLLQGVTSEVVGNCGIGAAPRRGAGDWLERMHPGRQLPDYDGYRGYLARLDEAGPSLNLAVLAGHGALRAAAAPSSKGPLSAGEMSELEGLLDEALDAGVVGLSSGLIYEPGRYADERELSQLCRRLVPRAPVYATHLRNEADRLLNAVDEALRVAEEAGVGLQLSHHKAHGRNNWGRVRESLARVDAAVARGADVWLDQYPYTAGSTILRAIVEIDAFTNTSRLGTLSPDDLVLSSVVDHPELEGRSLAHCMADWGVDVQVAAERVLALDDQAWVIVHAMSEDDVRTVMRHPRTLFGSDGIPSSEGKPHPRLWGTFARLLGHYVREQGVLPIERMIERMTRLPCERFGLKQRGRIEVGAYADLVLFDPAQIAARASYDEPRTPPLGIEAVWVNGALSARDGELTGRRAGQALRSGG
ncbi:MAG TPA: D-aminoacylase [Polyangiaceae bacterium]|nr:D-aminoacylase [Polyangiaceae bacterium]